MRKKIRDSLTAKVCLSTAVLLLAACLLVYAVMAWMMPRTYSNKLNEILEGRVDNFISELEQVPFEDCGSLFDQFIRSEDIVTVELFSSSGESVPYLSNLPKEEASWENQAVAESGTSQDAPVLSGTYYFTFADSSDRYMLIVSGSAGQVMELQQSFRQIFPVLLAVCLIIAFAAAWLYSRIITGPVLKISRISGEMSALRLDWQLEENRTDELGTLEKSLNTLSCRLAQTLSDLQNANRKLEDDIEREKELEQARLDFFSAASHELKTPITIIKGQLEGMLLGVGAYRDREKYLARSLEVAGTLESMVQEILTISRLESGSDCFREENFDMVQVIRQYLNETEDLIISRELQIQIRLPQEARISGNRVLMQKVFSNLIGNAVKYTPQGGKISIAMQETNGHWDFYVENTGVQIPEGSIPKLFDAFYRVDQSRNRQTGGSGLGLYIVQKILNQQGKTCHVCNTPLGVKFFFTV